MCEIFEYAHIHICMYNIHTLAESLRATESCRAFSASCPINSSFLYSKVVQSKWDEMWLRVIFRYRMAPPFRPHRSSSSELRRLELWSFWGEGGRNKGKRKQIGEEIYLMKRNEVIKNSNKQHLPPSYLSFFLSLFLSFSLSLSLQRSWIKALPFVSSKVFFLHKTRADTPIQCIAAQGHPDDLQMIFVAFPIAGWGERYTVSRGEIRA